MSKLNATRKAEEEEQAQRYADAILDGKDHDWPAINAIIEARWSLSALRRVKERAWQIVRSAPR